MGDTVRLPPELVDALHAVAANERTTASVIAAAAVRDALRSRWNHARGLIAEIQPLIDTIGTALGLDGTPDDNVLDDTCDDCDQRHGPDDPECAGADPAPDLEEPEASAADPSDPVVKPDPAAEPPRAGTGSGRDVWAAYAREELNLTVTADMSRGDIIRAVDVHHGRVPITAREDAFTPADEGLERPGQHPGRPCCQAAGCGAPSIGGGAKFCKDHTAMVAEIARLRSHPHRLESAEASREAVRLLIAGEEPPR